MTFREEKIPSSPSARWTVPGVDARGITASSWRVRNPNRVNDFGPDWCPFCAERPGGDRRRHDPAGNGLGTYLHGIFDTGAFWHALVEHVRRQKGLEDAGDEVLTMASSARGNLTDWRRWCAQFGIWTRFIRSCAERRRPLDAGRTKAAPRLLIAARAAAAARPPWSAQVLRALKNRGLSPVAFKCVRTYRPHVPHRRAGVESATGRVLRRGGRRASDLWPLCGVMNVIRGFMGLYDGLDPWILMGIRLPVAELLDAPVPW